MNESMLKSCHSCRSVKSIESFSRNASKPDGRADQCRECRAAWEKTEKGKQVKVECQKRYMKTPKGKAAAARNEARPERKARYWNNRETILARMRTAYAAKVAARVPLYGYQEVRVTL